MVFEHVERLKQEYTDKYVVVAEGQPELRRFKGQTGQVKTINMNGRALVQFDANSNIGWYDIELDYLKVVDKPQIKEPAAKATPAAKKSRASKATPKAKPSDMSAADILAAARGGGTKKPTPKAQGGKADLSVDAILAAARGNKSDSGQASAAPKSSKSAAKPAQPKKAVEMSVDDILAAARGKTTGEAAGTKTPPASAKPQTPPAKAPTASKAPTEMSVADILAAARGQAQGSADTADESATASDTTASDTDRQTKAQPAATPAPAPTAQAPTEMSVADILAAARGQTSPAKTAPKPTSDQPATPPTSDVEQHDTVRMSPDELPAASQSAPASASDSGSLPTEVADIVAWCREHDAA